MAAVTNRSSEKLSVFPFELWLCIKEFLDPNSTACVALCNHAFYHSFVKPSFWPDLARRHRSYLCPEADFNDFIRLLAQDSPEYFICPRCRCEKLHRRSDLDWPNDLSLRERPQQLRCLSQSKSILKLRTSSRYEINELHAIATEKKANPWMPPEAFRHREAVNAKREDITYQELLSVDARLSAEKLLLRSQLWIASSAKNFQEEILLGNITPFMCHHISIGSRESGRHFQNLIHCVFDHLDGLTQPAHDCLFCTRTVNCQNCHMEYKIEGKDLGHDEQGQRRVAIVVTKWIDLSRFSSHVDFRGWSRIFPTGVIPGLIRASFEDEPGVRIEQFTTENEAKLLSFLASHSNEVIGQDRGFPNGEANEQENAIKNEEKLSQTWYLDPSSYWVRDEFVVRPKVETAEEKERRRRWIDWLNSDTREDCFR